MTPVTPPTADATPRKTVNRHVRKVRPVPVSEMRTPQHTQRKFVKAQAEEYAAHFDLDKFGLPVVNHRDGVYWILDGQHRIGALKLWFGKSNPGSVDCMVYENLTDADAAELFLGLDDRRAISTFEKFHVACTAGRTRETDIRRTVESQGLKVSQSKTPGSVSAVSALNRVYDRSGAVVLGQVLRTLRDAYDGDAMAFDTQLIQGGGLFYNRYNGKTHEKHLVERLAHLQHGARGVLRRAEALKERTGNQKIHCVAAVLVDIHNKGLKPASARLPTWWKGNADDDAEVES
jgi:hypothetical protein